MNRWLSVRALCAAAFGLAFGLSAAHAADLWKAPPAPPAPSSLDIHGFFDLTFANDYITPRGLLVTNTGLTTQVLTGLVLDLYKNPMGFVNDVSFTMGTWNDLWSDQHEPIVGAWNEFDWFLDLDFKFAQYWKFEVEYGEFLPPAHGVQLQAGQVVGGVTLLSKQFVGETSTFRGDEGHVQLTLAFDDSKSGLPIAFNPYIRWFYQTAGGQYCASVVVLGNCSGVYYFEPGIVPTLDMKKYWGIPVTLTAPTWFSVGPTEFWNRNNGTTNFCGPASNSPCALSNLGLVATGLTAKAPIDTIIPTRLGNWYIKGGFQYFHIFNDALLAAQELTGSAGSFPPAPGTGGYGLGNYPDAHRNVVLGFVGTGFSF
jgi:hypothetical protein